MSAQIEKWLKQAGAAKVGMSGEANFVSTCPFCNPHGHWPGKSFAVHVDSGLYVCYRPACGATGHIRRLLVEKLGMSPEAAVKATEDLEAWKEVKLRSTLPTWENRFSPEEEVDLVAEATLGLYKFTPVYMLERGFTKKTLKRFEIGYDLQRDRVVFPMRSKKGRLLGFSTRATEPHDFPKYLHLGFKKSELLYGECYGESDVLAVGEGNADALALHQMFEDEATAVSTLGSKVSDKQVRKMLDYRKVLLAFDKDEAGDIATKEVGDRLQRYGHREVFVLEFPSLEGAKDPAEVLAASIDLGRPIKKRIKRYQRWRADQSETEEC